MITTREKMLIYVYKGKRKEAKGKKNRLTFWCKRENTENGNDFN